MVPHLSKDKNELKKCDQYVVGIILFPHVDIDHETERDHPLWVESYITYFLDIFPIPFAIASSHTHWPDLPKDAHTLLRTTRSTREKSTGNGSYFHFGILKSLSSLKEMKDVLSENLPEIPVISLQINIDGLPISKSGSKQLWPILARVYKPFSSDPFMVSLYCGESKPES